VTERSHHEEPSRTGPPCRLTRREFVLGTGAAVAGLAGGGTLTALAQAATRFPGVEEYPAEVATAWFELALELVRTTPGYSPPVAARALGYAGLTLYEAVVPGMDEWRSLSGFAAGLDEVPHAGANAAYHWPTVGNAALAAILRFLFPTAPGEQLTAVGALEERLANDLRLGVPRGVFTRSVRRGQEVAAAVSEWSTGDGGHEAYLHNFPRYEPPLGPGLWVPTPPGFLPALQPFWGGNRCLAIRSGAELVPGDRPPYSEKPASAFYAEALEVYESVNDLTHEQEAIARFWSDDPGTTPTPPGHSIAIATQVLRTTGASLALAAETYARVGMAVCDAFIACWYQKYVHNLLRPVTYINRVIDTDWVPLLVTPPFPEYPSGHSVQSGAAFQVLADLFGERHAFVDRTHEARGLPARSFRSFHEAADEAAISRLLGGIHFRAAIVNGLAQGREIGRVVSALPLRR
jgi:PAP2 superfamily